MNTDPDDLKRRLEHDENKWSKIQLQSNQQHAHTLNQLGDLFTVFRQLQAKVNKQEKLILKQEKLIERLEKITKELEDAVHRTN